MKTKQQYIFEMAAVLPALPMAYCNWVPVPNIAMR
jgi:hypothetical protein